MSHPGPRGPIAMSSSFVDSFRNDESISNLLGQDGVLKLILINYGTKGDSIAIDDLLTASANCSKLEFMAVNARDLTPERMRQYHEEQWGFVINTENCGYSGSACLYDCNGQHYGWRGGPGDRGFSGFPIQTTVIYQDCMIGSRVVINREEGSATEFLDQVMTIGAYFDRPDEIHIVFPDDAKLVAGTYALRDMVEAIFDGEVKLVSYLETLLTNQISDKRIKYIAVSMARRGHMYDYECNQHRPIDRVGQRYMWSADPAKLAAFHKQAMNRLNRESLSGGFRRGEIHVLGATTPPSRSRIIPVMDEPAHIGGVRTLTIPQYGSDWSILTTPVSKRPKGPITMPGLGERKKKGKHRSKR
ncbi:hypothetical protein pEaSNUABM37_00290 [Erwinia phage pEa_SNUABM_37]|nr:hypothetical protein pEaSNUABM37_00290 [Erwinia phage pEa_SNUABM_37]QXO10758.1 hypothetical protein pEaSNUABM48_00290 [Erwinia phage pEa_SNUABM_48]